MTPTDRLRIRLSILWIADAILNSAHCVLWTWEPGVIERFISGEVAMEKLPGIPMPADGYPMNVALALLALVWLIPLATAYLNFVLRDVACRRLNIAAGVFILLFNLYHWLPSCVWWMHGRMTTAAQIFAVALALWTAWRWKVGKEESAPAAG